MPENDYSCDVAKEFLTIISYCEDSFIKNIPDEIIVHLKNLAGDSMVNYYIDKNKTLMEQQMSSECKDLLTTLYYLYMTTPKSKEIVISNLIMNEK